ncbi:MAG: Redoxin protein [Candidatus Hydrogenedentes bacterium]|nr:Redoxin protein [Candidatus Hydrogenedentota bacterium]
MRQMIPYLLILLAPCAAAGFEFSGIVIDSADVPVAGADVWFAQEWSVLRTQTDAQGRFVFDSVETGPTDIVARKEGLAIGGISGPLLGPDNVTVRLGKPGVLTMRVIDHTYAPLEGARVSSLLVDDTFHIPLTALAEYGFPIRRSNAEGILEIDALPEGGHVQLIVTHRKCADTSVA